MISIVIPVWCEAALIAASVRAAAAVGDEVIVVDADSTDGTAGLAASSGARVVQSARGRGRQLHAGALAARGDVLLFLHADARLDSRARTAIDAALADERVVGGNFRIAYVPAQGAARIFTFLCDLRRRCMPVYYGDSAIFVRRTVYERIGGFRPMSIMEDYEFIRRLERAGRTAYLRSVKVEVSSRRFRRAPWRTLLLWTCIQWLYMLGVPSERLARLYK